MQIRELMPIVYYALANLIVGILACLRNFFSHDNSPYSLKGRLFLALLPAVGFGYKRYERHYQRDISPNPLLQCFVLRSARKFHRWFAGFAAFPITAWVVRLVLEPERKSGTPGDKEEGSNAEASDTWEAINDAAGWALTGIGDAVSWLFWFAILILPVFCLLWLLLVTIPAMRLKRLERRYGIGVNSNGDAVYLMQMNKAADSGKWPPY